MSGSRANFDSRTAESALRSLAGPEAASAPPEIPDYQFVRLIGQGSYGEVWLARSVTGAYRAIKAVYRANFDHDRPYEREFEGIKKFEPISQARETQVAIFHVGRNDLAGLFYYVMELADDARSTNYQSTQIDVGSEMDPGLVISPGTDIANLQRDPASARSTSNQQPPTRLVQKPFKAQPSTFNPATYVPDTLKSRLRAEGDLPLSEVLSIAQSLAIALDHLHSHGLVHRDIKPSNIIFVNGRAKLADIGLVTSTDATRSFVGTDGYIPPEGPGTPQADLYSLGKVLYEASMGQDRCDFPNLPSDWKDIPQREELLEFNEILLKACAQDIRARYASAQELSADLNLLQSGRSVRFRHSLRKVTRALVKVALSALLVVGLGGIIYSARPKHPSVRDVGWSKIEAANQAYRSGLSMFHREAGTYEQAVAEFEKAVALDPDFPRGNAGLATASTWVNPIDPEALSRAQQHAGRALRLAPDLDEAHSAVAGMHTLLTHDWQSAKKEALKAIELNPGSEDNYFAYAGYLTMIGHADEAVRTVEAALRVGNPSFLTQRFAAFIFAAARRYPRVIQIVDDLVAGQPSSRAALSEFVITAYCGQGNYLAAIEAEQQAAPQPLSGPDGEFYSGLVAAYRADGPPGYWRKQLERAIASKADAVQLAALYGRLGDRTNFFDNLQAAARTEPLALCFQIHREEGFDKFRSDPLFRKIIAPFNFPP